MPCRYCPPLSSHRAGTACCNVRRFSRALLQLRVMQKRTPTLCITPALRISPAARCRANPTTRGRSLAGGMFTADITARNCVVPPPTPAPTLYHRETIRTFSSIIRVAARCPDVNVFLSSSATSPSAA